MRDKLFLRVIDANQNRAREGIRVIEDIARFIIESPALTEHLKRLRQRVTRNSKLLARTRRVLTTAREVASDVGRNSPADLLKRKNYADILESNFKRAEESLRVLEEFSKLRNGRVARRFRSIRFELYQLEKKTLYALG